jgi:quercetin dioxygenase-like cupin family protein
VALKDPRRGPDRPLEGAVLSARIPALLEELRAEELWDEEDRNSRTVFKTAGLRVVLVALHRGAVLAPHKAGAPLTIQVVDGRLTLRAGGEELALAKGALVHLGRGVVHEVRAREDAAILLTLGGGSGGGGG